MSKFEDDGRRDQSIKSHKGKGQSEACRVPSGPTPLSNPGSISPQQEMTLDGNVVMTVKIANSMDIKEKIVKMAQIITIHANLKEIWVQACSQAQSY